MCLCLKQKKIRRYSMVKLMRGCALIVVFQIANQIDTACTAELACLREMVLFPGLEKLTIFFVGGGNSSSDVTAWVVFQGRPTSSH